MPHKTVLLLGRTGIVVDDVHAHITVSDVNLLAGTSLEDVQAAFDSNQIDIVIMGAGINIETRLSIIKHIFDASTNTTVHMKDWDSGPAGMLPFVDGVLNGLVGAA